MKHQHRLLSLFALLIALPLAVHAKEKPPEIQFANDGKQVVFENVKAMESFFRKPSEGLRMVLKVSDTTPTEMAVAVTFVTDGDSKFYAISQMKTIKSGTYFPGDIFDEFWLKNWRKGAGSLKSGEHNMVIQLLVPRGAAKYYTVARPADTAHGSRLLEKYDVVASVQKPFVLNN